MKINTRTRAIILSFTITLVFLVTQQINFLEILDVDLPFDVIKLLIVSVVTYMGTYWVLNFRVRGERFFTVLLFPSLSIFILTFYIELIIASVFSELGRAFSQILASIIVTIIAYILILTANILNLGYLQKIPLTQAGRAAHYVLTLISTYLFFSIIFSNSIPAVFKLAGVFMISYLFTSIALWTIEINYRQRLLSSLGIALMLVLFTFVILLWPISSEYLALILSLIYYMALGIALEIREVLSGRIWAEYLLLYSAIIFILFIVSNWGINGRLI